MRTRVGMNDLFKEQVAKWLKKQPYAAFVYEKEGSDEHIHAQIWLEEPRTKGNVMKPLAAMLKRCYMPDEYVIKVAIVIDLAYNDDFTLEYSTKDGGLEHYNPPDDTADYYPSKEDQEKFMEIAASKANWSLWTDLESKWTAGTPVNEHTVAVFIAREMFEKRTIKVEMDGRKRRQMCETFTAFMLKEANGKLFLPKDKHDIHEIYKEQM